jgi:hypothetical protein
MPRPISFKFQIEYMTAAKKRKVMNYVARTQGVVRKYKCVIMAYVWIYSKGLERTLPGSVIYW